MSECDEDAKFEKLKSETLDLLGGIGGTWMSFDDIASEHEACDGEIDRDALVVVLEELIEEGEIEHEEHRGVDEYRWRDRSVEEDMGAKVRRLEAEIASLREEAWRRERLVAAWIGVLGGVRNRLRGALPGNDLAAEVRRIIDDIERQVTL